MITIYKNTESGLEVIPEVVTGCWVSVIDPSSNEIETLTAMGVPQDFITYPLDLDERARSEREDDGTLLVVLRVPFFQGTKTDIPYITIPLGIILTNRFLITVCRRPHEILQDLSSGKVRGLSTAKRNRFVLRILLMAATRYLNYLREINRIIETLEDQIVLASRNREMLELLKYQKSLVYFTTALRSNELMLERLQRWQVFKAFADDEDLLEDVITENQQAIEMVGISTTILSSTMDSFASLVSNNLNEVMKFLASVTVVMSIPTIVTSFFGMNVSLPFQEHPWAYIFIIGLFIAMAAVVVAIFWKRDWF